MEEIWRRIEDVRHKFTRYEVSNMGRVRSIRLVDGEDFHCRILSVDKDERGENYGNRIRLRVGKVNRKFSIAYLMAKAFIPNPDNLPYACHLNGDNKDDRIENIVWSESKILSRSKRNMPPREPYDIYVKGFVRPIACGVMAASPTMAVKRWRKAISDIMDFERTYGVFLTENGKAYLNGIEMEIRKVEQNV